MMPPRYLVPLVVLSLLVLLIAVAPGQAETFADALAADAPTLAGASGGAGGSGGAGFPELATMSGIIGATLLTVEAIKRATGDVQGLGRVPTWIYAVVCSTVWVLVARYWAGTLQGDVGPLIWQAALLAGSASGFYTWLREPGDSPQRAEFDRAAAAARPIGHSYRGLAVASLVLAAALLGGCVTVTPADQAFFASNAAHTRAYSQALHRIEYPPSEADWQGVVEWTDAQADKAEALDAWSRGAAPLR